MLMDIVLYLAVLWWIWILYQIFTHRRETRHDRERRALDEINRER